MAPELTKPSYLVGWPGRYATWAAGVAGSADRAGATGLTAIGGEDLVEVAMGDAWFERVAAVGRVVAVFSAVFELLDA